MSSLALALVLVSALLHASWNVLAKRAGGDLRFILLIQLSVVVLWSPLGSWFAWREAGGYGAEQWSVLVGSAALHIVYFAVLLRGYRVGDLSVVYPLARGSGPLLTALAATLLLGESLGWLGWTGVALVVLGIVSIAGGTALWHALAAGAAASSQHARLRAGVTHGLTTGIFIALYSVVDGYAVKRAGISPVAVDWLGNCVRLPLTALWLALGKRPSPRELFDDWRRRYKSALAIGAIAPAAYVLVLYAVRLEPLSRVAPAREVSMLCATFLGGTLLQERGLALRLFGAGCVAGGVIALSLA